MCCFTSFRKYSWTLWHDVKTDLWSTKSVFLWYFPFLGNGFQPDFWLRQFSTHLIMIQVRIMNLGQRWTAGYCHFPCLRLGLGFNVLFVCNFISNSARTAVHRDVTSGLDNTGKRVRGQKMSPLLLLRTLMSSLTVSFINSFHRISRSEQQHLARAFSLALSRRSSRSYFVMWSANGTSGFLELGLATAQAGLSQAIIKHFTTIKTLHFDDITTPKHLVAHFCFFLQNEKWDNVKKYLKHV